MRAALMRDCRCAKAAQIKELISLNELYLRSRRPVITPVGVVRSLFFAGGRQRALWPRSTRLYRVAARPSCFVNDAAHAQ